MFHKIQFVFVCLVACLFLISWQSPSSAQRIRGTDDHDHHDGHGRRDNHRSGDVHSGRYPIGPPGWLGGRRTVYVPTPVYQPGTILPFGYDPYSNPYQYSSPPYGAGYGYVQTFPYGSYGDPALGSSNGVAVPGWYRPAPPQSVILDSRSVPLPALPSATVTLRNDGPRDLLVALVDHQEPDRTQKFQLPVNAARQLTLVRDAGAKKIDTVRTYAADGRPVTRTIERRIEPQSRYELVVHEVRIQSIAIDRTPRGNNAVEDINFNGRPLGRFDMPPGPQLQSGTIDVYRAAKSQGNAATIAPILATEKEIFRPDPLERAIRNPR